MVEWHPILALDEQAPGVWFLTSQRGPYAVIRLLEVGGELGYRATTYAQPRQLVGYYRTLTAACTAAHRHHVRSHGPQLDPATIYPDLSGHRKSGRADP